MMSVKSSEEMLNMPDEQWNKAIEMIVGLLKVNAHAVAVVAQRYSVPDYLEEVPWGPEMCYSLKPNIWNEEDDDESVTIVAVYDREDPCSFEAFQGINFYEWSQMIDLAFYAAGAKGFSYARYAYQQDVDADLIQRLGKLIKNQYGLNVEFSLKQDWESSPAIVRLTAPFAAPLPGHTWLATIENVYGENVVLGTFKGVDRKTVLTSIVEERKCPARCVKLYRLADGYLTTNKHIESGIIRGWPGNPT